MRYTLLLHYPELTADELGPDALAAGMQAFNSFAASLDDAGVLRAAEMFGRSDATVTVTLIDGELVAQDGPLFPAPEHLAGSFVIEVDDVDAALQWAAQAPSASWGHIEVRPVATRYVDGEWRGDPAVR